MLLYKYYTFVKQKLNYANNNKPFLTDSKINLSNVKSIFRICIYLLKVDLNTIYLLLAIQLDQLTIPRSGLRSLPSSIVRYSIRWPSGSRK